VRYQLLFFNFSLRGFFNTRSVFVNIVNNFALSFDKMRLVVFDNNFAVGNSVSGATRRQFLTQRWAFLLQKGANLPNISQIW
jgi:hypothetical protein